jgi:hypothetical protein
MDPLITDQIRVNEEHQRVLQEINKIEREIQESGAILPRRWALRKAKDELRDIEEVQELVKRALDVERMQMTGSRQVTIFWDQRYPPINTYGHTGVIQT